MTTRGRPKGYPRTGGRKPGTRNKATAEIKEVARSYGPAAIKKLAELAGLVGKAPAESESARVQAIGMLLDRGYGKPSQAIAHSGTVGTFDLSKVDDDTLNRLAEIRAKLAVSGADPGGD